MPDGTRTDHADEKGGDGRSYPDAIRLRCRPRAGYSALNLIRTFTRLPSPLAPRAALGTVGSVRPCFPRQTLVSHVWPSTVARTGVRPQPCVTGGASRSGTGTKCQPLVPGYRKSTAVKLPP